VKQAEAIGDGGGVSPTARRAAACWQGEQTRVPTVGVVVVSRTKERSQKREKGGRDDDSSADSSVAGV